MIEGNIKIDTTLITQIIKRTMGEYCASEANYGFYTYHGYPILVTGLGTGKGTIIKFISAIGYYYFEERHQKINAGSSMVTSEVMGDAIAQLVDELMNNNDKWTATIREEQYKQLKYFLELNSTPAATKAKIRTLMIDPSKQELPDIATAPTTSSTMMGVMMPKEEAELWTQSNTADHAPEQQDPSKRQDSDYTEEYNKAADKIFKGQPKLCASTLAKIAEEHNILGNAKNLAILMAVAYDHGMLTKRGCSVPFIRMLVRATNADMLTDEELTKKANNVKQHLKNLTPNYYNWPQGNDKNTAKKYGGILSNRNFYRGNDQIAG